jgi:hypothetical protein
MTRKRFATIVAVLLGATIATFGIVYGAPTRAFEGLDAEWTPAAYFSGGVLFAAALLVHLYAQRTAQHRLLLGVGLAGLLWLFGFDEIFSVHEWLEDHLGVDWQLLYLPVGLVGLAGGLLLLRSVPRESRVLLVLAGVAWVVAQLLEKIQWVGETLAHPFLVLPEELLEMTGSSLIVVAVLLALPSRRLEAAPAGEGAPEGDLVGVLEVSPDGKA